MANPVSTSASSRTSEGICNIGPRIAIRGNITGEEDLVIEGRVEGSVSISGHLVVAPGAVVEADIEVDTMHDDDVNACIVDHAKNWRFPAPQSGSDDVQFSYPFIFQASK